MKRAPFALRAPPVVVQFLTPYVPVSRPPVSFTPVQASEGYAAVHLCRLSVTILTAVAACVAVAAVAEAQPPRAPLTLEPTGATGEAIWPAFESWSRNEDGTLTLLLGYMNRNDVVVEIPIGDDNRMGPGAQDMGQPTHFLPGRNIGVFTVTVSPDQAERTLTWTIRVNNQVSEIAFGNNPEYFGDPFLDLANGNTPPAIRVGVGGDELQGPPRGIAAAYTTTVGEPLTLLLSVVDKPLTNPPEPRADGGGRGGRRRAPLSVTWKKFRGPGEVTFEAEGIDAGEKLTHEFDDLAGGETMTSVTFSEPGRYRLSAWGNDDSTAPGDGSSRQCCWTTAPIDVTVNP